MDRRHLNLFSLRRLAVGVAIIAAFTATASEAAMITVPLYESTTLVTTPTLTVTKFDLSAAGTLHVSLTDLAWPDLAQSLSFSLSEPTSVLAKLTTPGSLAYEVTGPVTLFASVYAAPTAAARAALYHLSMTFTSAAPVPLPAGIWLLLSGMTGLGAMVRKKRHGNRQFTALSHTPVIHA